jgi:hypothetical protein
MHHSIFMVNDEPFCIWEFNLPSRNMEFLDNIDTGYFYYLLKVHSEAEDEMHASIALKTALHHAVETMYSLLCAYIQAPDCAYAWVSKCSNRDLGDVIKKIDSSRNNIFTKLNIEHVTWENVADSVFSCYLPGTEKNKSTTKRFAQFWSQLAKEFADNNHIDEYNSIKHGLRIRPGGFSLAVGLQQEQGVPAKAEDMKLVSSSQYGTSFLKIETIGNTNGGRSIRSRRVSLNWKIEKVVLLLQLVLMSIENIISALKIANGADARTCQYVRPEEDTDFDKPWEFSPGINSFNMGYIINEDDITLFTKKELQDIINNKNKS